MADSLLEHFPDYSNDVASNKLEVFVKSKLIPDTQFVVHCIAGTSTVRAIRNIDNKKAFGVNEIHFFLVTPILCHIFNNSIRNGIFFDLCKHSLIIFLHKGGPKNNAYNFRPISILCTISN